MNAGRTSTNDGSSSNSDVKPRHSKGNLDNPGKHNAKGHDKDRDEDRDRDRDDTTPRKSR